MLTDRRIDELAETHLKVEMDTPVGESEPVAWVEGDMEFARAIEAEIRKQTATCAEFALAALVAAGHVSQELIDRAMELPGAPSPVARAALTRQQLREAFHKATGCTLGGDIDLAERVCGVVERAHGITPHGRKDAP